MAELNVAPFPSPGSSAAHPPCELSALPFLRAGQPLRCNVGLAGSCRLPLGREAFTRKQQESFLATTSIFLTSPFNLERNFFVLV